MVFLLLTNIVLSLGIRPAKTIIESEHTQDYSGTFWVVNSEHNEFSMKVYTDGEMGRYVALKTKELSFREDIDALPVEFDVHLPAAVPPGEAVASIVVEQDLAESTKGIVSSKIAIKHKIIITGPYPAKYVTAKLNFHEDTESIRIVSEVENKGREDIGKIKTTFYVNDKNQQEQVLETEEVSLSSKENKLLDARLDKKAVEKGEFAVLAITTYDDQQVEVSKKLLVGKPEIEVTYFDKYFLAGKINQYSLDLLNKWNTKIENVFVDIVVQKDGEQVDEFRTKSTDIEAEALKRINDYFDARGKELGVYSFDMVVHFWNTYRMESKTFRSEIIADGENALAGAAVAEGNTSRDFPLFWVVIGIIVLLLSGYVLYRYGNRESYEGEGSL